MTASSTRDRGAAAVVLAAGAARRFGGAKAAVVVHGRPLVAHAVEAARGAGLAPIVVVVGAAAGEVAPAVPAGDEVQTVVNPAWRSGQASSLRAGLAALGEAADVAVVLLADQPGIEATAIEAVIASVHAGAEAARAVYDDQPSHPVALARRVWPRLAALSGDAGARQLFGELDVADVRVAGRAPPDVDRPADLDRARG